MTEIDRFTIPEGPIGVARIFHGGDELDFTLHREKQPHEIETTGKHLHAGHYHMLTGGLVGEQIGGETVYHIPVELTRHIRPGSKLVLSHYSANLPCDK